ncbi:hypothetical protein R3P38DRAFT_2781427 [Favolaschia claudopus]|uniref:Uncharacterized protein n=1 Tax=Favolaschia claudopus TaxID=2862362 RepID=A0AAW0B3Z7_9AGAR
MMIFNFSHVYSTSPKMKAHFMVKYSFFFQASVNGDEKTLALISVYSPPNAALLEKSFQTVAECNYFGDDNLQVISILQIEAGVGMIPVDDTGKYFVAEKLGLELESMAGALEDDMNTQQAAFSLQQPTQNGLYGSVPATFFPWNMPWESSLASSLTTASHNDLCNVNATYTNLFHAFTVAKEQLSTLQLPRVAFNTLSKSVTQSRSEASTSPLSTSLSTELADRKDPRLSKIRFWDRQAWNNSGKGGKKLTRFN